VMSARSNELLFAAPVCGDAVLDNDEQCDDGNATAGDGCNATCKFEACGNAVLDTGEQCDDGNETAGDGCNATCGVEACAYGQTSCIVCGSAPSTVTIADTAPTNHRWDLAAVEITSTPPAVITIDAMVNERAAGTLVSPGLTTTTPNDVIVAFVSSDGPAASGSQSWTVSGGGLTWTLEKRSNTQAGDAEIWSAQASGRLSGAVITATPQVTEDGMLTVIAFAGATGTGATGAASAPTGAPSISVPNVAPGSWVFAAGFDYDSEVARTPAAGQRIHQEWVAALSGTMWVQSSAAPSVCEAGGGETSYCGDGIADAANGETCDDGNTTPGDGCGATCRIEVATVACDDEFDNDGDGKTDYPADPGCTSLSDDDEFNVVASCGNSVLDAGEQCDDGNKTAGDGCNATCRIEACGNAVLDAGEQCDDGNAIGGDGCDAQCAIEVTGGVPYHLEVGGSSWTDPSSGQQWSTDEPYETGGVITSVSGASINKTKLDPLYWTRRVGDGSGGIQFRLPVSGLGPYRVRLYFAELGGEVNASGERVFDVALEGGLVGLTDFDVFSEAGGNRIAVVRDVYVLVDDGVLDIDLVPVLGLPPMIAAIEVIEGGAPPASPKLRNR
jgi:cysteine-rich repeat protein